MRHSAAPSGVVNVTASMCADLNPRTWTRRPQQNPSSPKRSHFSIDQGKMIFLFECHPVEVNARWLLRNERTNVLVLSDLSCSIRNGCRFYRLVHCITLRCTHLNKVMFFSIMVNHRVFGFNRPSARVMSVHCLCVDAMLVNGDFRLICSNMMAEIQLKPAPD